MGSGNKISIFTIILTFPTSQKLKSSYYLRPNSNVSSSILSYFGICYSLFEHLKHLLVTPIA